MLISFSAGPDESSLSEGVGRKQNSGLRPRNALITVLCKAPAASGRDVGAPPARRNPGERGIPARAPRISFPVFRTCNVGNCLNALLCSHGSCSKSFWDSPLVEGPARQVHPKTTTFCLVLGFTPSTQPSRAHQSQNDFEQLYSGPSVAPPCFPVSYTACSVCMETEAESAAIRTDADNPK